MAEGVAPQVGRAEEVVARELRRDLAADPVVHEHQVDELEVRLDAAVVAHVLVAGPRSPFFERDGYIAQAFLSPRRRGVMDRLTGG